MLHLWLPAVADALDFVHTSGVVHRDVKPANIFFDAFWGAFLGDFGIAKIVAESDAFDREATLTATSMGVGTPDYMGLAYWWGQAYKHALREATTKQRKKAHDACWLSPPPRSGSHRRTAS
jgi:serine/threonine protein kinase